jgi:hypothetical protein
MKRRVFNFISGGLLVTNRKLSVGVKSCFKGQKQALLADATGSDICPLLLKVYERT